jgi:Circularly permutated YpsA SLOG family
MVRARALVRIVSGGQTGVDRAALDAALAAGLGCGGWIPRGRRTEDGPLPATYPLRETRSAAYTERTRLNVRDSDATLILARGEPTGGTALTVTYARQLAKPYRLVDLDLDASVDATATAEWLRQSAIRVLNVAGPRESNNPGVYAAARRFLDVVFH